MEEREDVMRERAGERPKYTAHRELFCKFLLEHRITVSGARRRNRNVHNDGPDDDDDMLMVPTDDQHAGTNDEAPRSINCYRELLQRIKDRQFLDESIRTFIVQVPLDELRDYNGGGEEMADAAAGNTMRYQRLFTQAVDTVLAESIRHENIAPLIDTADFMEEHRRQALGEQQQQQARQQSQENLGGGAEAMGGVEEEAQRANTNLNGATQMIPPEVLRRFELRILPHRGTLFPFDRQVLSTTTTNAATTTAAAAPSSSQHDGTVTKPLSLRQVRAQSLGRLVTVTGMVVRASDVKPSCVVATYACDNCGAELYQIVNGQREFMPIFRCVACLNKADTVHMTTRGSKFAKYQELRIQELASHVPMGQVPRSVTVVCRGELARLAVPGDVCTIDAVFLPQRLAESGFKAIKAGLIATTYLEAQHLHVHKKSFDGMGHANHDAAVAAIATSADPVGHLASSIAPEIYGHDDIKRALLLMLVAGCTRKLPDGMRIRGDINVLLMGDPGVAKSQLLKAVSMLAPRAVYTTGKGSSGVGLTAAVTKDAVTGEMALEGGALVLADRGICCIDEFDKMDDFDRTAIHEVMEQQTCSVAKAGIIATLNARTSVLAAANPLYGRYNRSKSLSENINLPNSLLSRFDLLFLILDKPDLDRDTALARHVTSVHQNESVERIERDNVVPVDVLREYIGRARKHQPVVTPDVAPYIVEAYVSLRKADGTGDNNNNRRSASSSSHRDQTVMTARQLLSILRLSQAIARLRFSDTVAREDVNEAIRLTNSSKESLADDDNDGAKKRTEDVVSKIFHIIRDAAAGKSEVELQLAHAMVLRKGFTAQQLQTVLQEYEALQVIQVNEAKTHIYFVNGGS